MRILGVLLDFGAVVLSCEDLGDGEPVCACVRVFGRRKRCGAKQNGVPAGVHTYVQNLSLHSAELAVTRQSIYIYIPGVFWLAGGTTQTQPP